MPESPQKDLPLRTEGIAFLRLYLIALAVWICVLVGILALDVLTSPYPPTAVDVIGSFMLLALVAFMAIVWWATQHGTWFDIGDDGLTYRLFGLPRRFVPWRGVEDATYGIWPGMLTLTFRTKRGKKKRALTGTFGPGIHERSALCLRHVDLDIARGGPIWATYHAAFFWMAISFCVALIPIAFIYALDRYFDRQPALALICVAVGGVGSAAFYVLWRQRRAISWTPDGITVSRGRHSETFAWDVVRIAWGTHFWHRVVGGRGIRLHIGNRSPLWIMMGGVGVPRFVAAEAKYAQCPGILATRVIPKRCVVPLLLAAMMVIIAALQLMLGFRYVQLLPDPALAWPGNNVRIQATLVEHKPRARDIEIAYAFETSGRQVRGSGYLHESASKTLATADTIPIQFLRADPTLSVPVGDVRIGQFVERSWMAGMQLTYGVFAFLFWRIIPRSTDVLVPRDREALS